MSGTSDPTENVIEPFFCIKILLVLCNTRYFVFMTAYKGALKVPLYTVIKAKQRVLHNTSVFDYHN